VLTDSLKVLVTDPSAPKDFETFARLEGHTVSWERLEAMFAITLKLKSPAPGDSP
jgi:TusA-related sulfurtransferase